MLKLHQVLAITPAAKKKGTEVLTNAYQLLGKADLINGLNRTYTPFVDEPANQLPNESKNVQIRVKDTIRVVQDALADFFNITAQRDFANLGAVADVKVNGLLLVEKAPTTYLLWLEDRLVDLHTFVSKLPILDTSDLWTKDEGTGMYVSATVQKNRTKKEPRVLTLAAATDKHPAQVQVLQEDIPVGQWTEHKLSGAIPRTEQLVLLDRVEQLQRAVKLAREEANSVEAPEQTVGTKILSYLFD